MLWRNCCLAHKGTLKKRGEYRKSARLSLFPENRETEKEQEKLEEEKATEEGWRRRRRRKRKRRETVSSREERKEKKMGPSSHTTTTGFSFFSNIQKQFCFTGEMSGGASYILNVLNQNCKKEKKNVCF